MIRMTGETNLSKVTPLVKANTVLEKVIAYSQTVPSFLNVVGIFRQSGDSTYVDEMYSKVEGDPERLQLENEQQFCTVEYNVTGLLKRFILDDKMQWSNDAALILHNELSEKLDSRNFVFNLKSVIDKLIEKNQLEEAKMLHNVLHMAYLVSEKSAKNKMPPSILFQTYAPWLAGMAKANDGLSMMLTMASKPVTSQNLDTLGLYKAGNPVYSKTFDQTYPQAAANVAKQHTQIPSHSKTTSSDVFSSKSALGWVNQKAIPSIKHFFMGAKEKPVNTSAPTLPIDKIVDVPPTKPSWQTADTPEAAQQNPEASGVASVLFKKKRSIR